MDVATGYRVADASQRPSSRSQTCSARDRPLLWAPITNPLINYQLFSELYMWKHIGSELRSTSGPQYKQIGPSLLQVPQAENSLFQSWVKASGHNLGLAQIVWHEQLAI